MDTTAALNGTTAEIRTSFADLCRSRGYTITWTDVLREAITCSMTFALATPVDESAILALSAPLAIAVQREVPQPCALVCSLEGYMRDANYCVHLEVSLA